MNQRTNNRNQQTAATKKATNIKWTANFLARNITRTAKKENGASSAPLSQCHTSYLLALNQPQHLSVPSLVSMDSTPSTGLSVTRFTPVSKKSSPGVFSGLLPSLAHAAIASIPSDAISSGYCCDVAPITPSATSATPGQPPSTDTISTSPSRPTALSAS